MTRSLLYAMLLFYCCWLLPGRSQAQQVFFIENKGQWGDEARYRAEAPGAALFLTEKGFVYNCVATEDLNRIHHLTDDGTDISGQMVNYHAYRVNFSGMNPNTYFTHSSNTSYHENYIRGNDSRKWVANARACETVKQHEIYKGIDLSMYSKKGNIKYDFEVSPKGNPADIVLSYSGVTPQLTKDGHLRIKTSVNEVREDAPYAYQVINGKEIKVPCFYKLKGQQVTFSLPQGYNKQYDLVIDPALIFSTYSAAQSSSFWSYSTTYDKRGCLYAGGQGWGIGWPVTTGAFQMSFVANTDASIIKYDSAGTTRLYATYYGGSGMDLPHAMITNANGELFIAGSTGSADLPVTSGCYDASLSGPLDMFITHFDSTGSNLLGATYIGGSSSEPQSMSITATLSPLSGQSSVSPCELILDSAQHIWVVGSSSSNDFPVTANAPQPTQSSGADGIIFELSPNCSQLIFSTYYGGSGLDGIKNCQFNSLGKLVFCGSTTSPDLATSATALHPNYMGNVDGFVGVMDTATHSITYATYLGTGGYEQALKLQINKNNNQVYILGRVWGVYPITPGTYSMPNTDMFIDVLSPDLSLSLKSTTLGSTVGAFGLTTLPTAFLRDACGNIYIASMTPLGNNGPMSFPLTANAFQSNPSHFWFGTLSPDLSTLTFGTYLGNLQEDHTHVGIHRFDPNGVVYHSICSTNALFPSTPGSWSPTKQNGTQLDVISFKFNFDMMDVFADFELAPGYSDTGCAPYAPELVNLSTGATSYLWNFDDGNNSNQFEPLHSFVDSGLYQITLIAYNDECQLSDTAVHSIFVRPTFKPILALNDTFLCDPLPVTLNAGISNFIPGTISYHWEPANAVLSSSNNGQSAVVNPAISNVFTVTAGTNVTGECVDTASGLVTVSLFDYSSMYALPVDTSICPGDTVPMRAYGGHSYLWSPDEDVDVIDEPMVYSWPTEGRQYKVLITGDSGCKISRTVTINIYPRAVIDAGQDQDIKFGESATLHGYCELPCMWTPAGQVNPSNILTPIVSPQSTTTYYLFITSPEGCMFHDSVTVHVTDAVLPNAFSPNGDGLNDVFKLIPHDERVQLKDFSVYNRYGQRVFFTRNINEGWDGTQNGKVSDLNTYFYMVHYTIGASTYALKGDVTLIR